MITRIKETDAQKQHRYWLQQAEDFLGQPVCPFELSWDLWKLVHPRCKVQTRRGIAESAPVLRFTSGEPHTALEMGMSLCLFRYRKWVIRLVVVRGPSSQCHTSSVDTFCAVGRDDFASFRSALRRIRRAPKAPAPIMPAVDRERLWNNTVGFLKQPLTKFRKYNLAQRRGLLLLGAPGNGKTMTCRWLQADALRAGLAWRSVSSEEYRNATGPSERQEFFHLDRPGIVLFDDLDIGIRDREKFGSTIDNATFLSELDGVQSHHGVVYLFTSNAQMHDLDPAFRRPGRIDVIMTFQSPDAELREELIRTRWQPEIRQAIRLKRVISDTAGMSFADLEELRKLMALHFLDTGIWDWNHAIEMFHSNRNEANTKRPIGFQTASNPGDGDENDSDENEAEENESKEDEVANDNEKSFEAAAVCWAPLISAK